MVFVMRAKMNRQNWVFRRNRHFFYLLPCSHVQNTGGRIARPRCNVILVQVISLHAVDIVLMDVVHLQINFATITS